MSGFRFTIPWLVLTHLLIQKQYLVLIRCTVNLYLFIYRPTRESVSYKILSEPAIFKHETETMIPKVISKLIFLET